METDKLIEALTYRANQGAYVALRSDESVSDICGECPWTECDKKKDFGWCVFELLQRAADALKAKDAQLAEKDKQLAAAVEENDFRKTIPLLPLYTIGGHGYGDDDDEDFWCPVCREHLGTHSGYVTTCPRCGQTIHEDFEKSYGYDELRNTIWSGLPKNWESGPQEAVEGGG